MLVLKSDDGKISVTFHEQFSSAGLFRGSKSNMGLNTWKSLFNTPNALDLCWALTLSQTACQEG